MASATELPPSELLPRWERCPAVGTRPLPIPLQGCSVLHLSQYKDTASSLSRHMHQALSQHPCTSLGHKSCSLSHRRDTVAGPCPLPGTPSSSVSSVQGPGLALRWDEQSLADGDSGTGPQLPEGPMRMEHPPMGPVQVMLSWGWSSKAQHSWTDRHSRIPWYSRTPARHIDHERALPVQSMYAWTGWYRRCSEVLKMLQGHTWPHGPQPQAGRRESENKGTGWGGGCSTSPPRLGSFSVAHGGHHTSAAASPLGPESGARCPACPVHGGSLPWGTPLFSASQGQGMGCRTMHTATTHPRGAKPPTSGAGGAPHPAEPWRDPLGCPATRVAQNHTWIQHLAGRC